MNEPLFLEKIQGVVAKFNPISIFLYGSRAKWGFMEDSDYEVGSVFDENNKVSSQELQEVVNSECIRIYSFSLEDFVENVPQTPFQHNIYMYELQNSSKIIHGRDIFTELPKVQIHLVHLLQEVRFCLWRATSWLLEFREWNKKLAQESVYKSGLYGLRCLEIAILWDFAFSYTQIFEYSKRLDFEFLSENLAKLMEMREWSDHLDIGIIYDTLTLLGDIEWELMKEFESKGNISYDLS